MQIIKSQRTRPQHEFITTDAKFPLLAGGLGSGKTKGGTGRICELLLKDPGINGAYYMPTYDLLKLRGIPGVIEDLIVSFGFAESDFTLNMTDKILKLYDYGSIIFRSYDNPERIVAYEVAHSIVDELDTLKKEKAEFVWRKIVERNRQPCNHPHGNTVGCVTTLDQGEEGFCYEKWGKELQDGYAIIKASTYSNPFLPDDYIDNILKNYNPDLARLYIEGEFVNLSGLSLFNLTDLLIDGHPVKYPESCDSVFAIIDTAVKDGKQHDSTAVSYYAYRDYKNKIDLVLLDWDALQIEGALLDTWLPAVEQRLKELKAECKAINLLPIYIEDKASGSILLQQAKRRGVNVKAIDSKFSAMSKSERAIAASGAVYQGRVKISQYAYDKQKNLKGVRKNHWLSQVTQFRIGNDHSNQADDLLDTFTYAILQLRK
jgi:phage terminase large subunit-like protein